MTAFTLHTETTAPAASRPLLANSQKAFGTIPGLHAVMADAPGRLEAYQVVHSLFMASSFDQDERTVVWQTINAAHACHDCVPAPTAIAESMQVSDDISAALRNELPLPNARFVALRALFRMGRVTPPPSSPPGVSVRHPFYAGGGVH